MKSLRLLAIAAVLAVAPATLLGCSDDTKDKVRSAAESAKEDAGNAIDSAKENAGSVVDKAGAQGAAEYVRGRVKVAGTDDPRSIDTLQGYVDDLPDQAKVSGLDDGDGDGLDDDGKIQFTVGDTSACLTLPESGNDTKVAEGAC
jgi:hypothetical protein